MIDEQHNDRADNGHEHTVEIESGNPRRSELGEEEPANDRADDLRHRLGVSQMVLDGFLDRQTKGVGAISRDDDHTGDALTSREREVIQLLAEGKTSKEVAVTLNLSVKTVSTYRVRLMAKLNFRNNAEIIRYAIVNNLVA